MLLTIMLATKDAYLRMLIVDAIDQPRFRPTLHSIWLQYGWRFSLRLSASTLEARLARVHRAICLGVDKGSAVAPMRRLWGIKVAFASITQIYGGA